MQHMCNNTLEIRIAGSSCHQQKIIMQYEWPEQGVIIGSLLRIGLFG